MAVYCSQCGASNRDGSLYCNACGQRLGVTATAAGPVCGFPTPALARYCSQCGNPLPAPAAAPVEGEVIPFSEEEAGSLEAEAPSLGGWKGEEETGKKATGEPLPPIAAPGLGPRPLVPVHRPGPEQASAAELEAAWAAALAGPPPMVEPLAREGRAARLLRASVPRLLYLLLLAAVVLPLAYPAIGADLVVQVGPEARQFYGALESMPPEGLALIAFDYDPGAGGELNPQARAIVGHLLRRGVKVVAVSLRPAGPYLAQAAFRQVKDKGGYRYGEDFVDLGYLAGEEAALASWAQDLALATPVDWVRGRPLAEYPMLQRHAGVRQFDLVVVLADNEPALRRWIGQIGSRYNLKMAAGLSALAAPQAQPFLRSGQLAGMLSGVPGAAEYEELLGQPGPGTVALAPQSLAHGVVLLAIAAGNVALLGSWALGRRRDKR